MTKMQTRWMRHEHARCGTVDTEQTGAPALAVPCHERGEIAKMMALTMLPLLPVLLVLT